MTTCIIKMIGTLLTMPQMGIRKARLHLHLYTIRVRMMHGLDMVVLWCIHVIISWPEELLPRLREAAKKVNFDFDKDFEVTDNSCKTLEKGEQVVLREKFAGNSNWDDAVASSEVGTVEKVAEKAIKMKTMPWNWKKS